MATKWDEIISDRNQYPDDHVLKLADGTEVKLGDVRPGHMFERDYRQKTSLLAREREALDRETAQRIQALQEGEAQLRQIAAEVIRNNPGMTRREAAQEVQESDDPHVQALRKEVADLKSVLGEVRGAVTGIQQTAQDARRTYVVNEHRRALADLKAADPTLDEQELVRYAQANMTPNLREAYKAMNHERIVESARREAREAAYKEGYEKAKTEVQVASSIPMRRTPEARPADAPKNMKEAFEAAIRDPEVMGPLQSGRVG